MKIIGELNDIHCHTLLGLGFNGVMLTTDKIASNRVLTLDDILEIVSFYTSISVENIKEHNRHLEISDARHLFFYIAKKYSGKSCVSIASYLNRDHATLINSIKKVENRIDTEPQFRIYLGNLIQILEETINKKNNKMDVKIKKLSEQAILPRKGSSSAAAYDVFASENYVVQKGRQVIPLGFALEMKHGLEAKIEPRSGHSVRGMNGFIPVNGEPIFDYFDCDVMVGKIDADYRGNVGVMINNRSDVEFTIPKGTAIAQMTFYKVEDVEFIESEELSETSRGEGGFGSTGK